MGHLNRSAPQKLSCKRARDRKKKKKGEKKKKQTKSGVSHEDKGQIGDSRKGHKSPTILRLYISRKKGSSKAAGEKKRRGMVYPRQNRQGEKVGGEKQKIYWGKNTNLPAETGSIADAGA